MPPTLPTGVVTFVFTDMEGSTRMLQGLGDRYVAVVQEHSRILRSAWKRWHGWVRGTEGDSFMVAFSSPQEALEAVIEAQRGLASFPWPDGFPVRVRMGIHTGEPVVANDDYVGIDVHRAARIAACAHGGQVVLSHETALLVKDALPTGAALTDLGEHRLKDISRPEWIWQVTIAGLPSSFPPLKSLETPSTLPHIATPALGRATEIARIATLLRAPDARVVTLTGPGGVGKTRLAIAVAETLPEDFKNGLFFVALAGVRTDGEVLPAVARGVGVEPGEPSKVLEQIVSELRPKAVLLVIDNLEQIVEAAGTLGELVQRTSRVRVLATSRVPLRIRGERIVAVEPLQTEAADALFFERAIAVAPGVQRTEANVRAVVEICRRLDGLPLAIELAAARTRTLAPPQLLERLGSTLGLQSRSRDIPARQQTLRATIQWSVDLLPEGARELHRAFALFPGGAALDGLEAVLGRDPLDDLEVLVDHSLARPAEEGRYEMLPTIRELALELLQAQGDTQVRERHARFYEDLALRGRVELRGANGAVWRKRLALEGPNVAQTLSWALDPQAPPERAAIGTSTAGAMAWFWYSHSDAVLGIHWLERARDKLVEGPSLVRGHVLNGLGVLYDQVGRYAEAVPLLDAAREVYEALGEECEANRSMNSAGSALRGLGRPDEAREHFEDALVRWRRIGDEDAGVAPLFNLACLALDADDGARARTLLEQVMAFDARRGDEWAVAVDRAAIGQAQLSAGDPAGAVQSFLESIPRLYSFEEPDRLAEALAYLGIARHATGEHVQGVRLIGAAWAVWSAVGLGPTGADLTRLRAHEDRIRAAMDPDDFERARRDGALLTLEQAVAYATAAPIA